MDALPKNREVVCRAQGRAVCAEYRLVLEAAGIVSEVLHHHGEYLLMVAGDDASRALAELAAYQRDNADTERSMRAAGKVPVFGGTVLGLFGYAAVLGVLAFYQSWGVFGIPWAWLGQMRAGDVMSGQVWRLVTALTLHADAGHLLSNLAFGGVFGLLSGRILGGGFGWLTILISGAFGNGLNAMVRDADHTSIGASTAVFGALGVMVAHALLPRWSSRESAMKRWSPLIGGILIFAFVGLGGERTDVLAHAGGMLAGLVMGWFGCRVPERWLASGQFQIACGGGALVIVILAWVVAVSA